MASSTRNGFVLGPSLPTLSANNSLTSSWTPVEVAVEDPVFAILRHLGGQEAIRAKYGFSRLPFSDNNREITHASGGTPLPNEDLDTEEPERRGAGPNKRAASELRRKPRSTNPDGAGLRTRPGGDESLAFVYDYKAAHKIAADHVNLAISKETLFMEVVEQVNRTTSRTGAGRDQFEAEARLAMALTQVFDYMVTYGVGKDVGDASCENWAEQRIYTAVAQLSSFCLLSLQSDALQGPFLDAALKSAKAVLKTWAEPYEDAAQFSAEETESSQAASSSPARRADPDFVPDESPIGRKVALRPRSSCRPPASSRRDDEGEDKDEDGSEDDLPPPWTRPVEKRKGGSSYSSSEEDGETRHSAPTRQYCSQACLLGLKRGRALDDSCPNVLAHRVAGGDGLRHPVTADEFTRLVSEQLRDSPYRGCLGLGGWGKRGATGVLFKVELGPYGYTFVGKGTLSGGLEQL
ncbi:metalloprotease-like protein [Apiospora marii]|uniref:Metalloprotease-like protein n=1 Tax=Apiospora marii TaxID=335849 RepID=A0ABR1RJJ5_9PEZI